MTYPIPWGLIGGGGFKALGSIMDGNSQAGQLRADASFEKQNARNLDAQARQIGAAGARDEEAARREYRAFAGGQAAAISESGLGMEGSALDIIRDSETAAKVYRQAAPNSRKEKRTMTNWIPVTGPGSRMPTREDTDERGAVAWKWADGTTCTGRFEDSGDEDDPAVAWLPLPPYTPPKPGPTKEECARLITLVFEVWDREMEVRRWFADVTARIEREKQT